MSPLTTTAQLLSISTALIASGGIATLTLFDVPELASQPASRSLPSTCWLFSRGSHIFPTASILSTFGFTYLVYTSLPTPLALGSRSILEVLRHGRVPGYILAAALSFAIAPATSLMIPTNFRLIELNEKLGGARSEKSAKAGIGSGGGRSAEQSVDGKGDVNQFGDLSGPMGKTRKESSRQEDEEVKELLTTFGRLNMVRAVLIGAGGMVGLWTALV